jgi:hypothetical protein
MCNEGWHIKFRSVQVGNPQCPGWQPAEEANEPVKNQDFARNHFHSAINKYVVEMADEGKCGRQ